MGLVLDREVTDHLSSFFINRFAPPLSRAISSSCVAHRLAHSLLRWQLGTFGGRSRTACFTRRTSSRSICLARRICVGTNLLLWGQDIALFLDTVGRWAFAGLHVELHGDRAARRDDFCSFRKRGRSRSRLRRSTCWRRGWSDAARRMLAGVAGDHAGGAASGSHRWACRSIRGRIAFFRSKLDRSCSACSSTARWGIERRRQPLQYLGDRAASLLLTLTSVGDPGRLDRPRGRFTPIAPGRCRSAFQLTKREAASIAISASCRIRSICHTCSSSALRCDLGLDRQCRLRRAHRRAGARRVDCPPRGGAATGRSPARRDGSRDPPAEALWYDPISGS